jgi:hypothetical protein
MLKDSRLNFETSHMQMIVCKYNADDMFILCLGVIKVVQLVVYYTYKVSQSVELFNWNVKFYNIICDNTKLYRTAVITF